MCTQCADEEGLVAESLDSPESFGQVMGKEFPEECASGETESKELWQGYFK